MTDHSGDRHDQVCVVIDDDPSVCDSLGVLLETRGFAVRLYGSGAEFLAAPHTQIGHLIVDQHMAGVDGLEVVSALRREGIVVPTVLVTGRIDDAIRRRAQELGVPVLEKPFSAARLFDALLLPAAPRDD
jgi:two-component system, LuxR family, response regulator FixJ